MAPASHRVRQVFSEREMGAYIQRHSKVVVCVYIEWTYRSRRGTRRLFENLSIQYPAFKFLRIALSDYEPSDRQSRNKFYVFMRHRLVDGSEEQTEETIENFIRYCLSDRFDPNLIDLG